MRVLTEGWPWWPWWPSMVGHGSRRRAAHTHLAAVCFERGWPWWPWWPSMIGHESRRPAAKPRLGSGVPRASASAGVESACPWPATTRAATVPPVRPPWLGLGQALTPSQIRDAAARANAGAWLGPGTHPGGLGVLNARDVPCPKPAECPAVRRCAGPAPPHRLRSARSATRRPGGTGRYGAVVLSHRVRQRPSAKGAHELCRLRMRLELRCHSWHGVLSPLVPTSNRRDPPPSIKPVRHREGGQSRPQAARTARRAPEPGAAARERVLLVCLRWGINSVLNQEL